MTGLPMNDFLWVFFLWHSPLGQSVVYRRYLISAVVLP